MIGEVVNWKSVLIYRLKITIRAFTKKKFWPPPKKQFFKIYNTFLKRRGSLILLLYKK